MVAHQSISDLLKTQAPGVDPPITGTTFRFTPGTKFGGLPTLGDYEYFSAGRSWELLDIPAAVEKLLGASMPGGSFRFQGGEKKPYCMKSVPTYYRAVFDIVYSRLSSSKSIEMGLVISSCALHGVEILMSSTEVRQFISLAEETRGADLGIREQVKIRSEMKDWKYKPKEYDLGGEPWSFKIDSGVMAYFERCMSMLQFKSKASFLIPNIGAGLAGQTGCHPDFTKFMKEEMDRQLKAIEEQTRIVRKVFDAFKS